MVFYLVPSGGTFVLRSHMIIENMGCLEYSPLAEGDDTTPGLFTKNEFALLKEVWMFCEEHDMKQRFYMRLAWNDFSGLLMQVEIDDPEHAIHFKLRWS